jgi:hypothetical protein
MHSIQSEDDEYDLEDEDEEYAGEEDEEEEYVGEEDDEDDDEDPNAAGRAMLKTLVEVSHESGATSHESMSQ